VTVYQKHFRPARRVAMADAAALQAGWLHLDQPRTLGGVKRSYGWPIGSTSARLALPASALGGERGWAAPVSAGARAGEPQAASFAELLGAASANAVQPSRLASDPAPEPPKPEPQSSELPAPRRIPQSDVIFVGRPKAVRPEREAVIQARRALAPEPPKPVPRSALVPNILPRLRPWLAAAAALAMVGVSFYGGTQWSRWQVSAAPASIGQAAG
jgi:hypothetical protein